MKTKSKNLLGEGNWLVLEKINYLDEKNVPRDWEAVSRKHCGGAVLMIAELVPSGKLVLIRQLRPPAGKVLLEFPAGLIDPGENPADAAVRELREETGYRGTVVSVLPPACTSPGLTGETVAIVRMRVDEAAQGALQTDFDEGENIETLTVRPSELASLVAAEYASGRAVDAKIIAYAVGCGSL